MATMISTTSIADQTVAQLKSARDLALKDPSFYDQILPGILPLTGPHAALELRRWGAEFLAETFASPVLVTTNKQTLSLLVLDRLREYLDIPGEDVGVVKAAVQTAASIYPLVFAYAIRNADDATTWQNITAIKSSILRRLDTAPAGVRICCIRFVQKVVQTQTPGPLPDPRRPDKADVSIAIVPENHPLLLRPNLEAEASGLLDRLLGILQEDGSDPLLVTATLNGLGGLLRSRPSIAHKIINAVLLFNPLRLANSPMTPRNKVAIKSIERTTRVLLLNVTKKNPTHPLAGRIQGYIERLHHIKLEIFSDASRKRPAPAEPADGPDVAKRQRLGAMIPNGTSQAVPPLLQRPDPVKPPGPVTLAQLYTLTQEDGLKSFDVKTLAPELVAKMVIGVLKVVDISKLQNAFKIPMARWDAFVAFDTKPLPAAISEEEEEEYEPEFEPSDAPLSPVMEIASGPFKLPSPEPATPADILLANKNLIGRLFEMLDSMPEHSPELTKPVLSGGNFGGNGRRSWVQMIARLATRPFAGTLVKQTKSQSHETDRPRQWADFSVADAIRERLYLWVIEDFRTRLDHGIAWLSEEWYTERTCKMALVQYEKWANKVLDGFLPYLNANDWKIIARFLSEVPLVTADMLRRVKELARDPEKLTVVVMAVGYLATYKWPTKDICMGVLEDLYFNYDGATAKGQVGKVFNMHRSKFTRQDGIRQE